MTGLETAALVPTLLLVEIVRHPGKQPVATETTFPGQDSNCRIGLRLKITSVDLDFQVCRSDSCSYFEERILDCDLFQA